MLPILVLAFCTEVRAQQMPVGAEKDLPGPVVANGELDTTAFLAKARQVVKGGNEGPTSPYYSVEARVAAGDSLLKVAQKWGFYKGQIKALTILGNVAESPAEKKAIYHRIAHLAATHDDSRYMGWAYCALAADPALGVDTCEYYLRLGVEYLRQSPDTNWFPQYYGTLLELLSSRNDLFALYRASHEYLAEPRISSRPYHALKGYNHLRHVFQCLEEPDSTRYYLDRMHATYDAMSNKGLRYGSFTLLMDAYLGSGTDNRKAIDMGLRRLAVDIPELCLRRWNSGHIDTSSAYADLKYHDPSEEMTAHYYLGRSYTKEHRYDSAVYHLRTLLEMAEAQGHETDAVHFLGAAEYEYGDRLSARKHLERGEVLERTLGTNADRALIHKYLFKLDSADGRWEEAASHLQGYYAFTDSVREEQHQVELRSHLFDLRLKDEQQKAEVEQLKARSEADRQRVLRNIGFGVAGFVLVLLAGLWRQRNRISKEKKRSEELLLNILPEEVAEELKDTGTAAAKHFDNATILFTDFKGFTQASEKMTPQELVEELNTCFKAFDHIITARGIEKIKTIGDAYMCASGLPDPKTSSPADVVYAALEMQAFMTSRKRERDAQGKPAFEMRVGIHTGPVVAGIVGVKKFQYDIWGDTVNTASRMESSGEVGQVNISEATYALVREQAGRLFHFTPRGKVQAKGKGEMEMYFVTSI